MIDLANLIIEEFEHRDIFIKDIYDLMEQQEELALYIASKNYISRHG